MPSQDNPQNNPSVPSAQQPAREKLKKSDSKLRNKVPERIKKEKILIQLSEKILSCFQNCFNPEALMPLPSSLIEKPRSPKRPAPAGDSKAKLGFKSQLPPLPADTQIFIQELIRTARTNPSQNAQAQKAQQQKPSREQVEIAKLDTWQGENGGRDQAQTEGCMDRGCTEQDRRQGASAEVSSQNENGERVKAQTEGCMNRGCTEQDRRQGASAEVSPQNENGERVQTQTGNDERDKTQTGNSNRDRQQGGKRRIFKKKKALSQPPAEEAQSSTKKVWLQRLKLFLVPAIAALIGVVLILYPVVATRHNNAHQRRILENYRVNLEANNATELENALKRADEYNRNLAEGKITDPFLVDIIPDSYEYQSYLQQLNVSGILGQIVIPSIRANLPIYHGTEDHTLQKGVGHLFGSSLPVGGKDTHSILTGHSGLASATMFDNLHKVKKGDKIFLNVSGRNMQYGVIEIKVVLPNETDSLVRQAGKDLLTLITCTPYGINSHRLFVTAEREHPVEEKILNKELSRTDPPWETWMIVLIVIAVSGGGLISLMLIHSFLAYRKRKEEKEEAEEEQENQQEEPQENQQEEPQEAEARATEAGKDPAPTDLDAADTGAQS